MSINVTSDGRVLVDYVQRGVAYKTVLIANEQAKKLHKENPNAILSLCSTVGA